MRTAAKHKPRRKGPYGSLYTKSGGDPARHYDFHSRILRRRKLDKYSRQLHHTAASEARKDMRRQDKGMKTRHRWPLHP